MPQISPMSWSLLYIYFISTFLFTLVKIYFIK